MDWLPKQLCTMHGPSIITCIMHTFILHPPQHRACLYRVFQKSSHPKNFWNFFTSVKSFCAKFCKFVGNSYPHRHRSTNFCGFILICHKMALIFPGVPIVFTLSSFEYSHRKWKCSVPPFWKWRHFSSSHVVVSDNCEQSVTIWFITINIVLKVGRTYQWENVLRRQTAHGRSPSPTAWFTQNGWASVVDSTADFLNSAQLSPFVRVTGNGGFCTKSFLTKRLHAQFVVVRQCFSLVGRPYLA